MESGGNEWHHGTLECGTVHVNRKGLPPELDKIKLKKQGKYIVQQKGNMRVTVWRDKKNIAVL